MQIAFLLIGVMSLALLGLLLGIVAQLGGRLFNEIVRIRQVLEALLNKDDQQ